MKKIFSLTLLLLAAGFNTLFAQAGGSVLKVRLSDNSPVYISVDGQNYSQTNGGLLSVNDLQPGQHEVQVFRQAVKENVRVALLKNFTATTAANTTTVYVVDVTSGDITLQKGNGNQGGGNGGDRGNTGGGSGNGNGTGRGGNSSGENTGNVTFGNSFKYADENKAVRSGTSRNNSGITGTTNTNTQPGNQSNTGDHRGGNGTNSGQGNNNGTPNGQSNNGNAGNQNNSNNGGGNGSQGNNGYGSGGNNSNSNSGTNNGSYGNDQGNQNNNGYGGNQGNNNNNNTDGRGDNRNGQGGNNTGYSNNGGYNGDPRNNGTSYGSDRSNGNWNNDNPNNGGGSYGGGRHHDRNDDRGYNGRNDDRQDDVQEPELVLLTAKDIAAIKLKVAKKATDAAKSSTLQTEIGDRAFSTEQARGMIRLLKGETARLQFARWAIDGTTDVENFSKLNTEFKLAANKREIKKLAADALQD